jgi:predicted MFS family arabinose efflux permease
MVLNIATTVPIAAAGFLVEAFSLRTVILSTAVLMLIAGVLTWLDLRFVVHDPEAAPAAGGEGR